MRVLPRQRECVRVIRGEYEGRTGTVVREHRNRGKRIHFDHPDTRDCEFVWLQPVALMEIS